MILKRRVRDKQRLGTDAEVLREILHRYRAIDRPDAIQPAYDALLGVVEDVLPVDHAGVDMARDILLARWSLSAGDAFHVAVMRHHGIDRILSFDRGFDSVPGIQRVA